MNTSINYGIYILNLGRFAKAKMLRFSDTERMSLRFFGKFIQSKYKKLFAAFLFALIYTGNSYSQQDLTIHLMPVIPQSNYTNPAFKPVPKWYFGFPALSSFYIGVGHSGFVYKDLIHRRFDDSLEVQMDNIINKLGKKNCLSADITEEILSFGIRVKKNFFNFSITEKISFRFSYPYELISLIWKGNGQYVGQTTDFSGIGINAIHYREYAVGYARDINNKIVVGGRLKYLQGLMNVCTKRNKINVDINEEDFAHTANTDFLVNASLPPILFVKLDSIKGNDKLPYFDAKSYFLNDDNKGFGIDIGGYFKYNNKFSFGASILDLGYIRWKEHTYNYTSSVESFTFDGVDINQFFNTNDSMIKVKFNDILDSLADIFKVKETGNSYWSPLTTKLYLTGIYSLTPRDKVGLLVKSEFFNKGIHSALTVSYNKWFFNMLSATASYSIMNRGYMNLGFGLALNLGSFQTYVLTDNFYSLLAPERTRNVNVHFGFNFIFGYKIKEVGKPKF